METGHTQKDRPISIGDAADMLGVTPKTLIRWADEGLIAFERTLGGHRRFHIEEIERVRAEAKR